MLLGDKRLTIFNTFVCGKNVAASGLIVMIKSIQFSSLD